ncbi:MAG: RHS repeat domain-containing protein, partial [Endomicrobiales bacterium]
MEPENRQGTITYRPKLKGKGFGKVFPVLLAAFSILLFATSPIPADYDWGNKVPILTSVVDNGQNATVNMTKTANLGIGGSDPLNCVAVRFKAKTTATLSGIKFYVGDASASNLTDFRIYLSSAQADGTTPDMIGPGGTDGSLAQTGAMAYGDLSNAAVNNSGSWLTVNFSAGSATLIGGEVYWVVISSLPAASSDEAYVQSVQGPAGYQPSLFWPTWGSESGVTDTQQMAFRSNDGGATWTQTDLTPCMVFIPTSGTNWGNPYEETNNRTVNSTSKLGQVFNVTSQMGMAKITVRVLRTATVPDAPLLAVLFNRDTNTVLSTATFLTGDIGISYDQAGAVFSPPVILSPNTNGYRLYFTAPGITNGGSFSLQTVTGNETGYDAAASFMGLTGQAQSTTGDPVLDGVWADLSTTLPYDCMHWFTVDTTPPSAGITLPAASSWRSSLASISGTAQDNYYLSGGSIAIRNQQTGKYWDGGGYNSTSESWFWIPITSPGIGLQADWGYSFSKWSPDTRYLIKFIPQDMVRSTGTALSIEFVFDNSSTDMASRVTLPNSGDATRKDAQGRLWYNSLATISGTADDNLGSDRGQIDYVDYLVKRLNPALGDPFFNGSGWQPTEPTWPTADPVPINADNVVWNKGGLGSIWGGESVSGSSFTVTARITDKAVPAANRETVLISTTFYWDVTVPTSSITSPTGSSGAPGRTGVALNGYGGYYDGHSGISKVEYRLYDLTDNKYWDGSGWWSGTGEAVEWPDASVWASSWTITNAPTFTSGEDGDRIIFVSRAKDISGNYQTDFTDGVSSRTFVVDMTAPNATTTLPSQQYRSALATITGNAVDSASSINAVELEIKYQSGSDWYYFNQWAGNWQMNVSTWNPCNIIGSGGSVDFEYPAPGALQWVENRLYYLTARARDAVGNRETPGTQDRTFYYDVSFPTSTINSVNGAAVVSYYSTLSQITGTAQDMSPGDIAAMQLYINKQGTNWYWDAAGSVWTLSPANPVWNAAGWTGTEWTSDLSGIDFETGGGNWSGGGRFVFRSRARDFAYPGNTGEGAGNREGGVAGGPQITITYDKARPDSVITNISPEGTEDYKRSLATISGTASDNQYINNIKVYIYDITNAKTWNGGTGTGWDPGDQYSNASYWRDCAFVGMSSGTWTYPSGSDTSPSWVPGSRYRVISRAWDRATNQQIVLSTASFTFDTWQGPSPEFPDSNITSPADDSHVTAPFASIAGTAGDDTPNGRLKLGNGVELKILRFNSNGTTSYWSGGGWQGNEAWFVATANDGTFDNSPSPESWAGNAPGPSYWTANTSYTVVSRALDRAGNYEQILSTHSFVYDTSIPTATVSYPSDGGYISQTGKVQGTALDLAPGKMDSVAYVKVRIRDLANSSTYYVSPSWTDTTADSAWNNVSNLSPGGTWWILNDTPWQSGKAYEINVRSRDKAGNWQLVYSTATNVKADFAPPSAVITLPVENPGDPPNPSYSYLPTISGTCFDAYPGQIKSIHLQIRGIGDTKVGGTGEGAVSHIWDAVTRSWRPEGQGSFLIPVSSITIVSGTTWYFNNADSPDNCNAIWSAAGNYKCIEIVAYAEDYAGNTQTVPGLADDGTDFKYEVPPPVTTVSKPAYEDPSRHTNAPYWTSKILSGTRNSYTSAVDVAVRRLSDNYNWYGSSFSTPAGGGWVYVSATLVGGGWQYDVTADWAGKFDVNNTSFTIRSRGYGAAGYEAIPPQNNWLYDTSEPDSWILRPAGGTLNYQALATLSGTAADNNSFGSVSEVKVAVQRLADNYYWDRVQSSWISGSPTPAEVNFNTTTFASPGWSVVISSPIWEDGKYYRVWSRSKDKADNTQSAFADNTSRNSFLFDVSSPVASVTTLTHNNVYSQLSEITGTAWDSDPDGAGSLSAGKLDIVELQIKRNEAVPKYWTGTSWSTSVTWTTSTVHIPGVAVSSWSYASLPSPAQWTHNYVYTVAARAKDSALPAGNTQQIFAVTVSSVNIQWDNLPPETAVTDPAQGDKVNPAGAVWSIFGSASDAPAGTAQNKIKLQLSRVQGANTYYWDGTGAWFLNVSKEFSPDGYVGTVWQYDMPAADLVSDQRYTVKVRADDNALPANSSAFPSAPGQSCVEVVVDTTPPVSAVTFPKEGRYYRLSDLATLQGSANGDLAGIDRVEVEIRRLDASWVIVRPFDDASISGNYGDITWSSSTAGFTWTSNKRYAVESRAYDLAGSTQVAVSSVTFRVDDNAPLLAVTIPSDLSSWAFLGIASGTFSDSESYVSTVTVAIEKLTAPAGWWNGSNFSGGARQDFAASTAAPDYWSYTAFSPSLEDNNKYKFYLKAIDIAGNASADYERTVTIDTTTPVSLIKYPQEGRYYSGLATISGTSSDPNANATRANAVRLRIHDVTADKDWYPGSGWGSPGSINRFTVGFTANEPLNWSWNAADVTWVEGNSYKIEMKARDQALKTDDAAYTGNWQVNYSTVGFSIDRTTPTFTVDFPQNNLMYNSVVMINGGLTETLAGIEYMQIVIKGDYGGGVYWDEPTSSWKTQIELEGLGRWPSWTNVSVYQSSWAYKTAVDYLPNNSRWHKVWLRVRDNAGNQKAPTTQNIIDGVSYDNTFMFDRENPVSTVVTLASGQAINSAIDTITGTATDVNFGAGVTDLKIRIRRDDGTYWQEPGWGASVWLPKSTLAGGAVKTWTWVTGFAGQLWQDNHTYAINTVAYDAATNSEVAFSTTTVTFDTTLPEARVSTPTANGFTNYLAMISGTAGDPNSLASGPYQVKLAMRQLSDGLWWGGSNFDRNQTDPYWIDADTGTDATQWKFLINDTKWTTNTTYWVIAKARDKATNWQVDLSTVTFTYDRTRPDSALTRPLNGQEYSSQSLATISGTASDTAIGELKVVDLRIFRGDNSTYWNGSAWVSGTEVWISSGIVTQLYSSTFTYVIPAGFWTGIPNSTSLQVTSRGRDKAGNTKNITGVEVTFTYISPEPAVTFTVPGAGTPHFRSETHNYIAGGGTTLKDPDGVDLLIKRLADNYTWEQWTKTWVSTESWNTGIDPDPGTGNWSFTVSTEAWSVENSSYNVLARGWNNAGISRTNDPGNNFVIDNQNPQAWFVLPNKTFYASLSSVSGTAADTNSLGALKTGEEVRVDIQRDDGKFFTGGDYTADTAQNLVVAWASPNWQYALPAAALESGRGYTFYAKPRDKAGNTASSSYAVVFDTHPPVAGVTVPQDGQVLRSLLTISGTASDPDAGSSPYDHKSNMKEVRISLYDYQDTAYWNNGSWPAGAENNPWAVYVTTQNAYPWQYTHGSLALASGHRYRLLVRAVDNADNLQSSFGVGVSSMIFTFDSKAPVSSITKPQQDGRYKPSDLAGATAMNGSASDLDPNGPYYAGLSSVTVSLSYLHAGDTYYWTGTAFSSNTTEAASWQTAQDVADGARDSSWNFLFQSSKWISDRQYR